LGVCPFLYGGCYPYKYILFIRDNNKYRTEHPPAISRFKILVNGMIGINVPFISEIMNLLLVKTGRRFF